MRDHLMDLWRTALKAADPSAVLPRALARHGVSEKAVVIAAGKAAGPMVSALPDSLRRRARGLVVCHTACPAPPVGFEVIEAGHPVPDAASARAGDAALALARRLDPDDCLVVLLSGGASALLGRPADAVRLEDMAALTRDLLASGAPIGAINTVRRALSAVAGGRLAAAAHPARVVTLAISDVVGDPPADIGSGPTVASPTALADARAVLDRFSFRPTAAIRTALADASNEPPEAEDPRLQRQSFEVIISPAMALGAVAARAEALGFVVHDLGADLEGEARAVARTHARRAAALPATDRPQILLSGGELTVTLGERHGEGGPNQEYALAVAQALGDRRGYQVLAADTDGRDGLNMGPAHAGGFADHTTPARACAVGLSLSAVLHAHDSAGALRTLGDALVTGPTGTNVNDLRMILVEPCPP
ncbi:MAG: glycerate kinase [Alphaproteobacteria bacterium]